MIVRLLRDILRHPANRGRPMASLLVSAAWQVRKRLSRTARITTYHGQRLWLFPDSEQSSAVVYFNGWPDWWEMQFVARYLRPGDAVVDIGANVGVYTVLLAARVGSQGRVFAFEPDASARSRLAQQVSLNGFQHVIVMVQAASERSGSAVLTASGSPAMRHLVRSYEQSSAGACVDVEAIALDDWQDWQHFTLLKVDVEGAEPLIFRGARQRLQAEPPDVILLELAGLSKRYGYTSEEVLSQLRGHDYRFARFDTASGRLVPMERPWEHRCTNVLAVHSGARARVEQRLLEAG